MQKTFNEIFTNRFGNILAIGNLALIAFNASGLTYRLGLMILIKFSFSVNMPARVAASIVFGTPFIPYGSGLFGLSYYAFGTLVFIYLQWLGIGWIAGKISQAIQPKTI